MERGEVIRPLIDAGTSEDIHGVHSILGDFFAWLHFLFHAL